MLSPKTLSSSILQPPIAFAFERRHERTPFVQTPTHLRTLHLAVPSPFFLEIELTENQCRSVSYSVSKGFHSTNQLASRGRCDMWHSRPTTCSEAVGESGKQA